MNQISLYPLQFAPIYQYRLWGGRRFASLLSAPLPSNGPIGEAWILSDRDDHPSVIANGPLQGLTLRQLLEQRPEQLMGKHGARFRRFPLLLKFLDVNDTLSVQVHPADRQTKYIPPGESGKTEAWVVLEAGTKSRIFAGLKPGATAATLQAALAIGVVADSLASFIPKPEEGVFIPAGTVHSLRDVVVFEVQENSDVTFRLYDWNHIDATTGRPRPLQVDQALACVDFAQGAVCPVEPVIVEAKPVVRERLFDCEHFGVWRVRSEMPFTAGVEGAARVLVCIKGEGQLEHDGARYRLGKGEVVLLPAAVGACLCHPMGVTTVLEVSLPGEI